MTKMTNKIALETAIKVLEVDAKYAEVVEKLQKMLVQVEKKNSAERKPTATQTENMDFKNTILKSMEVGKKYTITDFMGITGLTSCQRVTRLVTDLKNDGFLNREMIKGKACFSLAV